MHAQKTSCTPACAGLRCPRPGSAPERILESLAGIDTPLRGLLLARQEIFDLGMPAAFISALLAVTRAELLLFVQLRC